MEITIHIAKPRARIPSTLLAVLVGIAGLTAAACATVAPDITPQEITEVDLLIRRAVAAGAERLAPELLGASREANEAARRASFARKPDEARRQLEEAKAYANAAEVRAMAEQRQREAIAIGREADALEARLQELQRRLRAPGQSAK
jgi:DNA repair photolyase